METLFVMLAGLLVLQSLASWFATMRLANYTLVPQSARTSRNQLRAAIILPCRGLDPNFEANIRAFLTQDYREYEILFVVESQQDPAYAALAKIAKQSRRNAWLLVAGEAHDCGQKVHNLLFALETLDANDRRAEVLVFADADAHPHNTWLAELVAPLNDRSVGATTGFRWYLPHQGNSLAAWLTSAWNASTLSLFGERSGLAWGGSTAILRESFNRLNIKKRWRGAVSDDYVLTAALQETGQRIKFVPQCLVATHADTTFKQLLEFTTRQLTITRIYAPRVWSLTAVSNVLYNLTVWGGIGWLLFSTKPGIHGLLILFLLGSLALGAVTAGTRAMIAAHLLPAERQKLLAYRWLYALCAPLVPLIFLYNLLGSAFTRRIVWRGIGYEMLSQNTTRIWQRDPLTPAPKASDPAPRQQKARVRGS